MAKWLIGLTLFVFASAGHAAVLDLGPVVGGATDTEARIWLRTDAPATVRVALNGAWSAPVATTTGRDLTASVSFVGLTPETVYAVMVEVDGVVQAEGATFRTFPEPGASRDFAILVLTDFLNQRNATRTYQTFASALAEPGVAMLVIGGDFDHRNPGTLGARRRMFRQLYDPASVGLADFVALLRQTPVVHHWDDHDGGGNNLDRTYPGWPEAAQVFREYVPTYPLSHPVGVWQRVRVGQVEMFVLDVRSQRDPAGEPDGPGKTMLGADQLAWLLDGLRASTARWKVIVSGVPVNPTAKPGDAWGAYQSEWTTIRSVIEGEGIAGVVAVSGDLHMGGVDDGRASGVPEMVVPGPNLAGCASGGKGAWSHGIYFGTTCRGYGLLTVLTDPDRLRLEVKDEWGVIKLLYEIE